MEQACDNSFRSHQGLPGKRKASPIAALDGVDLHVGRGEIHGIIGLSGAGKSTFVRMLTLLDRPTGGSIEVDGETLTGLPARQLRTARRTIGMVFHHVNLLDSRTAAQNIAHPLEIAQTSKVQKTRRVGELLELVGLDDRGDAYPGQLSGGQRQRVGIARALAAEPSVLLCDEPTSALVPATTRQILTLIRDIRDRIGVTVLLVTHEMSAIRPVCDAVSLLEHSKIAQTGTLADVAKDYAAPLAAQLVALPENSKSFGLVTVNVSIVTDTANIGRVLHGLGEASDLAGAGVHIEAGVLEILGRAHVGRFRVAVRKDWVTAVTEQLETIGAHVEVTP